MNPVKTAVLLLLRAYQRLVSPMLPSACRYVPTCSEYAVEAVTLHGVLRGGAQSLWRLLRCHPFARGGVDCVVSSGASVATGTTKICSH